jgi:hypothetical protein
VTTVTDASAPVPSRALAWVPSWPLITTRLLELRKRRGLMFTVGLLILGLPILVLGIRLLLHLVDAKSFGPAGTPSLFQGLSDVIGSFGFIAAAALGTAAGTTDLSDGVFRHLVITGRSRVALYLARMPAGFMILVPLLALAFASVCLVTSFAATSPPTTIATVGPVIRTTYNQTEFTKWAKHNPTVAVLTFTPISATNRVEAEAVVSKDAPAIFANYEAQVNSGLSPPTNELIKIGLWLLLEIAVGFVVGLGLGSLTGQRTTATIMMIVLQIIVTPILTGVSIPYFLNGQRLVVGVALDQLRPAGLASGTMTKGRTVFGGRSLSIPPMPTWAMIAVIVGWFVVWTAVGIWKMDTRDT